MDATKDATITVASREKLDRNVSDSSVESLPAEVKAVPARFRGTIADRRDMETLGRNQVLRSMMGFASTAMGSWEVSLPFFTFALIDGGTGLFFWGYIVVAFGMTLVYLSLAEVASMCPTAGGQYHWVSELAPPRIQKPLSFAVGWLTAAGWQVYLAGSCFIVGTVIQGLLALNVESYVWHNWHGTILTIAVVWFSVIFNTFLAGKLPILERIVLFLQFAGFLGIVIPLWVTGPRTDARTVLLTFSNNGGWSSLSLSCFIGLTTPLNALVGFDCSAHMAEETRDASLTLPRVLAWSTALNICLSFFMGITLIFNVGDINSALATTTGQPFLQIFYNTTKSLPAVNTMAAVFLALMVSVCIGEVATTSRQIWSFARDGGLPGSSWLAKVVPGRNIPLNAVVVSIVITSLLACINLGSTVALNAISALGMISILTSYTVTISCLIWRRLYGAPLPERRWSLGKYGLVINIVALLFVIPLCVVAVMPLSTPVTATNLNWAAPMFGGILIVVVLYYVVWAKHTYTGPVMYVKRDL